LPNTSSRVSRSDWPDGNEPTTGIVAGSLDTGALPGAKLTALESLKVLCAQRATVGRSARDGAGRAGWRWKQTVPPKLTPVYLDGLKERVDQVARSIPDPPMHVRTGKISTAVGRSRGYLFVEVPSTPYEPRQVDGTYYGRADTTRYRLSASEVERCYQLGLRI
jgi:hypothetical protein